MQKYSPQDIRNFAIVGHASCGKTILSEAMLACAGVIGRMGRIADGSTVSDYHDSEKKRLISVQTSFLHAEWMGKKFNILDTPGYLDFISEALSALRVADFAAGRRPCPARHRRRHRPGLEIRHATSASQKSWSSTPWTNSIPL